jgi:tRNA G26 N,N-dimethylase Trm1
MKTECPNCKHRFQTVDVDGVISERKLMHECLEESRDRDKWRGIAEMLASAMQEIQDTPAFTTSPIAQGVSISQIAIKALAAYEEAKK